MYTGSSALDKKEAFAINGHTRTMVACYANDISDEVMVLNDDLLAKAAPLQYRILLDCAGLRWSALGCAGQRLAALVACSPNGHFSSVELAKSANSGVIFIFCQYHSILYYTVYTVQYSTMVMLLY